MSTHPECSSVREFPAEISHCNGADVEPYAVRAREPVSGIGNILGDREREEGVGGREKDGETRSGGARESGEGRREGGREKCRVHATGRARSDDGRLPFPLHGNPARTHSDGGDPGRGTRTPTRAAATSLRSAQLRLGATRRRRAPYPACVTHDIRRVLFTFASGQGAVGPWRLPSARRVFRG